MLLTNGTSALLPSVAAGLELDEALRLVEGIDAPAGEADCQRPQLGIRDDQLHRLDEPYVGIVKRILYARWLRVTSM